MAGSHPQSRDTTHWDRYWAAPRVAACFEGAGAGYDAEIQAHWEGFFEKLPRGARLLDIGTGNGAIAVVAKRVGDRCNLHFQITGVDSADIDPGRVLADHGINLQGVEFRGKTDASALPFEASSYDALCSQYALEYMDTEAVLPELARVAAPGAKLQVVLHSVPGIAEQAAAKELELAVFLQQELNITALARDTLTYVTRLERSGRTPTPEEDTRARALIASFETALGRLRERIDATGGNAMLENTMGILVQAYQQRQHFEISKLSAHIAALDQEIEAHAARLGELRAAAHSESRLRQLCNQCVDAGFDEPHTEALTRDRDGAILGWLLRASRP